MGLVTFSVSETLSLSLFASNVAIARLCNAAVYEEDSVIVLFVDKGLRTVIDVFLFVR